MTAFKHRLMSKLDAAMDGLGGEQPRSVYHFWHQRIEDEDSRHKLHCDSEVGCVELVAGYIVFLVIKHGKRDASELTEYGIGLRDEYIQNNVPYDSGFEEWRYSAVKHPN